jgi:hypothetical protein
VGRSALKPSPIYINHKMFFSHECNFQGLPKDFRHGSDYDDLWRVAWIFVT